MKAELIRFAKKEENLFPLIAISKENKEVVMFVSEKKGITIARDDERNDTHSVGYISELFTSCFNKDVWDIPKKVFLKFENE